MPIFYQHIIDADTRLGIWKIEEPEFFFLGNVPLQREVTHPHKRLQHLAGRFLLQFLFPAFPYDLIRIADTRKPFLETEEYHFSISHCGDYAAAIVSKKNRVGIDIEIPTPKIEKIKHKFLNESEQFQFFKNTEFTIHDLRLTTLLWSCKEAVFKWYGNGKVNFSEHIQLQLEHAAPETINCFFVKNQTSLVIHYRYLDNLTLAWVVS